MPPVAGRHLDPVHRTNVEARLVMHQDDVWTPICRLAGPYSLVQPLDRARLRFEKTALVISGDCINTGAGEMGDIILVAEGRAGRHRLDERQADDADKA